MKILTMIVCRKNLFRMSPQEQANAHDFHFPSLSFHFIPCIMKILGNFHSKIYKFLFSFSFFLPSYVFHSLHSFAFFHVVVAFFFSRLYFLENNETFLFYCLWRRKHHKNRIGYARFDLKTCKYSNLSVSSQHFSLIWN